MAALTFIDSSAVGALIKLRVKAEDAHKKLTLTRVPNCAKAVSRQPLVSSTL